MPEQAFKALLQQEIFASVPSLLSLVQDKDVTAILAPNQWLADQLFGVAERVGDPWFRATFR